MTPTLDPARVVLDNGVTVIARQTAKTAAVTISLAMREGAAADPPDAPGAMFLLSRVIDRGTASRPPESIADALDNRGVSLSISVGRHTFSLSCTCLAGDFEPMFALLGEIVMAPTIPPGELATRKGQVITSLRQDEDSPSERSVDRLLEVLYGPSHPYGRPVKGTVASVDALTRDRLLALHAERFRPERLVVVVVGDVAPSQVERCAAAVFGAWRAAASPARAIELAIPSPPVGRRLDTIAMMNKSQADIAYGFVSIARSDPSYYAFLLMNNVLGQYSIGGRLGQSIRERQGMAYYVFSTFDASIIPGPFMVRAGVAAGDVERAIASVDAELHELRRRGVTGREMAESRQYLTGSMPRALETNAGIASFLLNAEIFGLGLDYDRRLPGLLMTVTIDDVNAAAAALDPARASIVVAGPYQPA